MIKNGLEHLLSDSPELIAGRRIGLLTNACSVDLQMVTTLDRLRERGDVAIDALFVPKDGYHGALPPGAPLASSSTGDIPVYPIEAMEGALSGIELLVIDLIHVGIRYFSSSAAIAGALVAASAADVPVLVLDRPAPLNGFSIEGPSALLLNGFALPARDGLTTGELAACLNQTVEIGCALSVVPMLGWQRGMWFDRTGYAFVPMSPVLPSLDALLVYPGSRLVEASVLSAGIGTARPYEYLGAPWLNADELARDLNKIGLDSVRFRAAHFLPGHDRYAGEVCAGVQIYVTNRNTFRPVEAALYVLAFARAQNPERFGWMPPEREGDPYPIDALSGGPALREHIDAHHPIPNILEDWREPLQTFGALRRPFLLYPA